MTTDSNVTPIPTSLERTGKRLEYAWKRIRGGEHEWIEGSLEFMQALAEAREQFQSDNAFGTWLKDNKHDHVSKDDRAALINMANDLALAREILTHTDRRSYRHIWRECKDRFRHVAKPTGNTRKNNNVARRRKSDSQKQPTEHTEAKQPEQPVIQPAALDDVRQFVAENLEMSNKALAARLRVDESKIRRARAMIVKAGGYVKQEVPRPTAGTGLSDLAKKYTPEEIGWPAADIINLPHPDHPGHTYGGWFIHEHGHVHLMPVKEREAQRKRMTLVTLFGVIHNLGKVAKDGIREIENTAKELKVKLPLDVVECQQILDTMKDGGKFQVKSVSRYYDDLMKVLRMVEPFGTIIKPEKTAV